jgi:CRISPR-associated exonuclease Cas4
LEPLVSQRFGIIGKPDYLVEIAGGGRRLVVPLEVKSRRRPPAEDPGHTLQLAAYCLLVEDIYKERPPHGYLRYADVTIQVAFTDDLRRAVMDSAAALRKARTAADVPRSHHDAQRCRRCGYVESCGGEALAGVELHSTRI